MLGDHAQGDQCFFEVLAERGLQRVKLARRDLRHKVEDFEEAFLLLQNGKDDQAARAVRS